MFVSIGKAAQLIGVSISTLRRWEREGKFESAFRTLGQHRRYCLQKIREIFQGLTPQPKHKKIVGYARVSSHDQKQDLERQVKKVERYCVEHSDNYELITDLGSGIRACHHLNSCCEWFSWSPAMSGTQKSSSTHLGCACGDLLEPILAGFPSQPPLATELK